VRRSLLLGAACLLLVVVVGLEIPFGITVARRLTAELGGRVEREAFAVAAAVEDRLEAGGPTGLRPIVERVSDRIGGRVLVVDEAGLLLADSLQPPGPVPPSYASRPEVTLALRGYPSWAVRASRTLGYDILVSGVPIGSGGQTIGAVRLSYPMAEVQAAIRRAWWVLGVAGLVVFAIGMALAWGLARWISRPLRGAAEVARRIARGDMGARVPVDGPDEVRELARDLNDMTARVADRARADRAFAANASHQLRTPLTALRLSLEEALLGPDPRGEARYALEQVDRLEATVEALIGLGRHREDEGPTELIDVPALVHSVAAALEVEDRLEVHGEGRALAHEGRVREVLVNLVANAVRYGGERIRVSIGPTADRLRISVEDDGPGVPDDERDAVFDRFARGRNALGPGSGLGLALARELAAADGGSIDLTDSELGGAQFILSYPLAELSAAGSRVSLRTGDSEEGR
jgi:signal transduction histidine kinase